MKHARPFPTTSQWGIIALALVLLGAGTIVIRARIRFRNAVGGFGIFLLSLPCTSAPAQDTGIAEKVNTMLQSPHDPQRLLVRFKSAVPQPVRDASHTAAGAVKMRSYRFVDGLTLVKVASGDLSAALVSYLSDANVLYSRAGLYRRSGSDSE